MSWGKKPNEIDIYQMELHEYIEVGDGVYGALSYNILRVAGGWIYCHSSNGFKTTPSVFVPFNNEFQHLEYSEQLEGEK